MTATAARATGTLHTQTAEVPCARGNQTPQTPQTPQHAGQGREIPAGFSRKPKTLNPANPAELRGLRGLRVNAAGFEVDHSGPICAGQGMCCGVCGLCGVSFSPTRGARVKSSSVTA
jgi:hypothetical protein